MKIHSYTKITDDNDVEITEPYENRFTVELPDIEFDEATKQSCAYALSRVFHSSVANHFIYSPMLRWFNAKVVLVSKQEDNAYDNASQTERPPFFATSYPLPLCARGCKNRPCDKSDNNINKTDTPDKNL